ncbi:hypothetical protein [uncultured Aeromicrobium sp.]|uniref:hypothetical protein n=1 Tax=uncultured Aeromicrobium sp. TaxID=337820 RepID=UPI0025EE6AB6|nr:hypothetical protein [uncultured Aeromicrobium sp.]
MTLRVPSRAARALFAGAATFAYYATPDFIASRRNRALTKAGLAVAAGVAAVHDDRTSQAATEDTKKRLAGATLAALPTSRKLLLAGCSAAMLTGSVAATVAVERWIFRRAERRGADGVRLPHTRGAVLLGALTTALMLIPVPDER